MPGLGQQAGYRISMTMSMSCLVCILANTPGGVKRSGLGAQTVGLLVVY